MRQTDITSRERPGDNFKWNDADFLRPTLAQGERYWLGNQWAKKSGRFPTINEIMKGVMEEEKAH